MSTKSSELLINLGGGLTVLAHDCRNAISVDGKSRTDKQLKVLREGGLTDNTIAYASTKKGKLGTEARGNLAEGRIKAAAIAAGQGNYTLMYEILVLETGKQLRPIRSSADYEMTRGFISGLRDNLKNGGYTNAGKMSTECVALESCLMLFAAADAVIAARKEADAERRRVQDRERAEDRVSQIEEQLNGGLLAAEEESDARNELDQLVKFLEETEAA